MKFEISCKKFFFILLFVFLFGPFLSTNAAVLYFLPELQAVYRGDFFVLDLRIDTEGKEVNVAEVYLTFPSYLAEAVDVVTGGSIFDFWPVEPQIRQGEISFVAGIPGGFKGSGSLVKINFLAKDLGRGQIIFKENSAILLNDGKGTPTELTFKEGKYEIIEKSKDLPVISSETHPNQNKWHNLSVLHLRWDLAEGAEYSYLLSRDLEAEPDEIANFPEGELIWMGDMRYDLKNEGDGIFYFSLRQKLLNQDWSKDVSRFKVMIDTTLPENLKIEIGQDPFVFGGKYFLSFSAQDSVSGVDYYEVAEVPRILSEFIGKKQWKTTQSPYVLEDQKLTSKVLVKAVDKAGNEIIGEFNPPYKAAWQDILISVFVLIIILAIWLFVKNFKRRA